MARRGQPATIVYRSAAGKGAIVAAVEAEHRRRKALARAPGQALSLAEFIKLFWSVLEPKTPLVWGWVLDAYCTHIEAIERGEIKSLVINVPPGMMKSRTFAVMWPAWHWSEINPATRWLMLTNTQEAAKRDASFMRRIIESDLWQGMYGHRFSLREDQNAILDYGNTAGGTRISRHMLGATGARADRIVIDDPHNIGTIYSAAERARPVDAFRSTISQRGSGVDAAFLVIMQRLHTDDLSGVCVRDFGFHHLAIPMQYHPKHAVCTTSLWRDPRTETGALAWPERVTEAWVEERRIQLGPRSASAQFDQAPLMIGGNEFKRSFFRYWSHVEREPITLADGDDTITVPVERLPEKFDFIAASWDLARKKTQTGSFACGGVFGVKGAKRYLLELVRRQMGYLESLAAIREVYARWKPQWTFIEEAALGDAAIDELRPTMPGVIGVQPVGDKLTRARANLPTFHAGQLVVPHPSEMSAVEAYIHEHESFPDSAYNDQVDMTSQALTEIEKRAGLDYAKPIAFPLGGARKW